MSSDDMFAELEEPMASDDVPPLVLEPLESPVVECSCEIEDSLRKQGTLSEVSLDDLSFGSSLSDLDNEELCWLDSEREEVEGEEEADSESEDHNDLLIEEEMTSSWPGPIDKQQPIPSCSSAPPSEPPSRKKRRGRKQFKKGFLKREKGSRSRSTSAESTSGYKSEDYSSQVNTLLDSRVSDGETDVNSCPSTLPSEADKTLDEDDVEEERETKKKTKKKKKPKQIGRREKHYYDRRPKVVVADDKAVISPKPHPELSPSESGSAGGAVKPTKDASTSTSADRKDPTLTLSEMDFITTIENYLLFILDDRWTVKSSGNILSLCIVTNLENPVVEKAITWTRTGKVNLLVHSHKLPANHFLWDVKKPDPQNAGKVADYLAYISKRLSYFDVCTGVQTHPDLWGMFAENASIDRSFSSPVLRSHSCHIIRVYAGRCSNCHRLLKKMLDHERHKKKKSGDSESASKKTNTRYMSREDLVNKMKRIQAEKKLSDQQVKRLRARISNLIEKHSVTIENGLGEDFVKILDKNTDKMTAVEKLFWEQQSLALSKKHASKTMRWHPTVIRLALQLRLLSPAAYDFVKGFISLPSQRRLFDYSQFTEAKEGIQEVILTQLNELIERKCPAQHQQYFSLLHDEMSIRSDLVYNSRTGELVGYTNLSSLEEELASLEAEIQGDIYEKKLAKKVLVFMLSGATNNIRYVVAVFSTDNLTASQLYARASDVIYFVEEAGAKVLAVICDGASTNRKFITMHFNTGTTKFLHKTENLVGSEQRPLFFMLDPPHLLKTCRNCFANSYGHRCTRTLCNNGQDLSWKAIEALFLIIGKDKFKTTKLSMAHVHLNSFSCMKVILAVQVFSKSVARALQTFKDSDPLKEYYNEELVQFILKMDRWFDCFNSSIDSKKKNQNPDLQEYTSVNDPRFDFLEEEFLPYFDQWEEYVNKRSGKYTKEQRSKMIISYQSLEGIRITVLSFIEMTKFLLNNGATHVSARNFNQDALEQYFSDQRRVRGADNNPTVKQVLHTRQTLHAVGQLSSGGKRGNTEDLRQMEVDNTPLLVKKPKLD